MKNSQISPEEIEKLIRQSPPDDPLMIEAIVHGYYSLLFRLAVSILDNSDDAQDTVQETLIAAMDNLHKFRGDSSFKTWIYAICVNKARSHLRKRKTRDTIQKSLENLWLLKRATPATLEERTQSQEECDEIWKIVDAIPDKHRLPVILRYVHELSITEIAEILNIREGTVHSRLHYARKKLQSEISQQKIQANFSKGWTK